MHWISSCNIKPIILYRYLNNNNENKIYQADRYTTKQSRRLIREIDVLATYWFLFQSPWVMFPFSPLLKTPTSWAWVSVWCRSGEKTPQTHNLWVFFKSSAKVVWPCTMQCAFPRLQGAEGHWEGLTRGQAERTEPPKATEPSGYWPQTSLILTKADQSRLNSRGERAG